MKKWPALLLIAAWMLSLAACGAGGEEAASTAPTAELTVPGTAVPESSAPDGADFEPFTFTDHAGNEVTISEPVETAVIVQVPLAATYVAYQNGSAEGLIGLSGSVLDTISTTLLPEIAPEILEVDTSFYDNGELNIEELLKLDPDVVFYNAGNTENAEQFAQAGLTAVGFSTAGTNSGSGDPTLLYAAWLEQLDTVYQGKHHDTMEALIENGNQLIETIESRTAELTDEEKADVMILFSWSDGTPMVSGSQQHFGHYWLTHLNVNNVAAEVTGVQQVNMEQVYLWDPDYIFMPGAGQISITPEQVLSNTVENADFSPISAVQNGNVWSSELGLWSWYTPNSDAPVVLLWLAKNVYPELFEDLDLNQEVKTHYQLAYHYTLSDEEVADLLDR